MRPIGFNGRTPTSDNSRFVVNITGGNNNVRYEWKSSTKTGFAKTKEMFSMKSWTNLLHFLPLFNVTDWHKDFK